MDLQGLPNPYDFANPVNEPALFVGRNEELEDIRYYLGQVSKVSQPINLAIMGERASGKTSMLNMAEAEAHRLGFCVVRVELDESDAKTQLLFFFKMFDSVITAACSQGAFGGLQGRTYDVYRAMVDAYTIPEDLTFCPFIFPLQYSRSMGAGNFDAPLTEIGFKRDMKCVRDELDTPVVILLDECDVLAGSRVHLEKLRNVFMNQQSYMLVISGTPQLFPTMDEVFSPIVRQFKKINVGPFERLEETKKCVERPIERLAIDFPDAPKLIERMDFEDLHELTGGRPYEIQLICHILFRRVQRRVSGDMQISLDALEDARKELESSQDVTSRPTISAVSGFDKGELLALSCLCRSRRATFDQLWSLDYVFTGGERWTRDVLRSHLESFKSAGVLAENDGIVSFCGDDFDRIYCKYMARNRGVALSIGDVPIEALLAIDLAVIVIPADIQLTAFMTKGRTPDSRSYREISMELLSDDPDTDPFESAAKLARAIYWISFDAQGEEYFSSVEIDVSILGTRVTVSFPTSGQYESLPKEVWLEQTLLDLSKRAEEIGCSVKTDVDKIPVLPMETLANRVMSSNNPQIKQHLSDGHTSRMAQAHVNEKDDELAARHGEFALRYKKTADLLNSLGYLDLTHDKLDQALEKFEEAASLAEKGIEEWLPSYNRGLIAMKQSDFPSALERFEETVRILGEENAHETTAACLIVPYKSSSGDSVEFREELNPNISHAATAAARLIKELMPDKPQEA